MHCELTWPVGIPPPFERLPVVFLHSRHDRQMYAVMAVQETVKKSTEIWQAPNDAIITG